MFEKIKGTGVALVTPFTNDGKVDYEAYEKLLEYTISNGVDYILVNGTTSESVTTTEEEKDELLKRALKINNGRVGVVYGIGGNNTLQIIEKIKKFNFSGIDALLSVSPYYNKPSQEGIYQHYNQIADVSPIPLILYNVPGRTSSNISASTTVRLSKHKNIIAIKEASGNVEQALEIIKHTDDDFMLISGDDLVTVPLISVGAVGVMSVLANAYPKEFSSMINSALKNNFKEAAEAIKQFVDINPYLYTEGNPVGIKQVLEFKGICSAQVRLPLAKASESLKSKIKSLV